MKDKLKTLKDILGNEMWRKVIKEEAIKWVKFYKKRLKEVNSILLKAYYQGKFEATMKLHNITEEDLKEKENEVGK